jgi:hypothetical protein
MLLPMLQTENAGISAPATHKGSTTNSKALSKQFTLNEHYPLGSNSNYHMATQQPPLPAHCAHRHLAPTTWPIGNHSSVHKSQCQAADCNHIFGLLVHS